MTTFFEWKLLLFEDECYGPVFSEVKKMGNNIDVYPNKSKYRVGVIQQSEGSHKHLMLSPCVGSFTSVQDDKIPRVNCYIVSLIIFHLESVHFVNLKLYYVA